MDSSDSSIQLIIDGGRHVCYKCGKSYKEKRTLKYHLKYECGVEPQFRCPQCPYRAKQKSSLKSHFALKHLNEINKQRYSAFIDGRFVCCKCGRHYKERGSLKSHQKFECGKEPQFQCPHCPFRAKKNCNLRVM
ncbi:longitudinals lacking protein, isoforms N/O/W/X/Y-like [Nilaparvata lugens]|uniref:longitudinals lacking protein, isoforms N/O/W/X/Y-like n=1 Tax=Nilaparvata lugens TaxID=108931 RepID=UPI00193E5A8C|nr:longitudinals lacking protein, isoforms N/O/W/X/Y-like [Nilaparvata lugens]